MDDSKIVELYLSRNESANGTSKIAYTKNNIFGHNAVDGSAYTSASGYLDVRSSIYTHGYGYINYGYGEVADSRYFGSHFGNKYRGMNVMYASDVYWGEKAANYYYLFDRDNGMLDYNYYQLVISNTGDINARNLPNTKSQIDNEKKLGNFIQRIQQNKILKFKFKFASFATLIKLLLSP